MSQKIYLTVLKIGVVLGFFVFVSGVHAAALEFSSPSQGEILNTGEEYIIVPEVTNYTDDFPLTITVSKLYYNDELYMNYLPDVSGGSLSSDNKITWNLPDYLPSGEYYFEGRIANTDVRSNSNKFIINSPRKIFPSKITKPAAGEKIIAGEEFEIKYNDIPTSIHNMANIDLLKGGKKIDVKITTNDYKTSEGYKLKIPSNTAAGDDYQIRIAGYNMGDEEVSDYFSLVSSYNENKVYNLEFSLPVNNFVKNNTYTITLNSNCTFTNNYSLWLDLGKGGDGKYRIHPLTTIDYDVYTKIFQYENVLRGTADINKILSNTLPNGQINITIPNKIGWYKVYQNGYSNFTPYFIETYTDGSGGMSVKEFENIGSEGLMDLTEGNYRFFATVSGYDPDNANTKCRAYGFSDSFSINNTINTPSTINNKEPEKKGVVEENNIVNSSQKNDSNYESRISIKNNNLYSNLKGKIILKVEASGEAYYVNPSSQNMYYLGRPDDAFSVMRGQGVGITNANLEKIPIGLSNLTGTDTDGDGLPDIFEDAIGTDKNNIDSDSDGNNDKTELENNYNPNRSGKLYFDNNFTNAQTGKIFIQVENNGEAWYVNPGDGKRYFLGRPNDAFQVMRNLGLGISNSNFDSL